MNAGFFYLMDIPTNTYDLACEVVFFLLGNEEFKYPLKKTLEFKSQEDVFKLIMDVEKVINEKALEDAKSALITRQLEKLAEGK